MIIYSMTATFGKLKHETLTLEPGLNIIHAPNEWGKSTWSAFLLAMLYGMDTRAKSTKTTLAEKERYVPWSGEPMAGRMDICWNGRDITIERKTKGRVPLGDFRAYETATGLEVKELTAANCGAVLLGVERSVYARSGFIRLNDMTVTDDDALRRRLNALVTTGDESGAGDRLAKGLKELKNRIRYNRTGLLPQAQAEQAALEEKLRELDDLLTQSEKTKTRLEEIEQWRCQLENHRTALAYAAAQADTRQVEQVRIACEEAKSRAEQAAACCETLPPRERAEQVLDQIRQLQEQQSALQMELELLPGEVEKVTVPEPFRDMNGADALASAKADGLRHRKLLQRGKLLGIFALVLTLCGCALTVWYRMPGLICGGTGLALLAAALIWRFSSRGKAQALEAYYGAGDPRMWTEMAETYARALLRQKHDGEELRRQKKQLEQRLQMLNDDIRTATNGQSLEQCRRDWESALAAWDARRDTFRQWQQAEKHYQTLKSMVKPVPAPEQPDTMDYSDSDTARLLSDCYAERRRLENLLGQYQGRMETLGQRSGLAEKLKRIQNRIEKLDQTYGALVIAQETLADATEELQRRFAPKISKRAQTLMARMTGGRYDRISLGADLSLRAGAQREDTLREALWRSDGTVDQLYLALRLAVSEELTPDAPLILDDALVRFDDGRLKSALQILREEGEKKQVVLFSCQTRERDMM